MSVTLFSALRAVDFGISGLEGFEFRAGLKGLPLGLARRVFAGLWAFLFLKGLRVSTHTHTHTLAGLGV